MGFSETEYAKSSEPGEMVTSWAIRGLDLKGPPIAYRPDEEV